MPDSNRVLACSASAWGRVLLAFALWMAGPVVADQKAAAGADGAGTPPSVGASPTSQPANASSNLPASLPPPPASLFGERPAGVYFLLEGVHFSGNSVFTSEQLTESVAPYLGQPINIAELEDMRLAILKRYTDAGYLNTGVVLPGQTISRGQIEFRIVEGRLDEIRVTGNGRLREGYLIDRLWPGAGPLNTAELQQKFRLLLNDPLIERLNATLYPGEDLGEAVLDLEVTPAGPYELRLLLDNHRAVGLGETGARLQGVVRNLTGWGDALRFELEGSDGLRGHEFAGRLPLTARGLALEGGFSGSRSELVEGDISVLDIHSEASEQFVALSWPWIEEPGRRFTSQIGLRRQDSFTSWLGGEPIDLGNGVQRDGHSEANVVELVAELVRHTTERSLALRSTLGVGVHPPESAVPTADADARFLRWLGQLRLRQSLSPQGGELLVAAEVQLADDSLLPMHRYALGGADSVRGYRQNSRVRDNGGYLSLEYRQALLDEQLGGNLQLAGFVDLGKAWDHAAFEQDKPLSSIGVGVLWRGKWADLSLYLAHGLNDLGEVDGRGLQDDGIHFQLSLHAF